MSSAEAKNLFELPSANPRRVLHEEHWGRVIQAEPVPRGLQPLGNHIGMGRAVFEKVVPAIINSTVKPVSTVERDKPFYLNEYEAGIILGVDSEYLTTDANQTRLMLPEPINKTPSPTPPWPKLHWPDAKQDVFDVDGGDDTPPLKWRYAKLSWYGIVVPATPGRAIVTYNYARQANSGARRPKDMHLDVPFHGIGKDANMAAWTGISTIKSLKDRWRIGGTVVDENYQMLERINSLRIYDAGLEFWEAERKKRLKNMARMFTFGHF